MDALEAGIYPMDFVQRYFASFYCVACTLMGNRQIIYTLRDDASKLKFAGFLPQFELKFTSFSGRGLLHHHKSAEG